MLLLLGRKASKFDSSARTDSTYESSTLSAFTVPSATSPTGASKRDPIFGSSPKLPSVKVLPHSRACVSGEDFAAWAPARISFRSWQRRCLGVPSRD